MNAQTFSLFFQQNYNTIPAEYSSSRFDLFQLFFRKHVNRIIQAVVDLSHFVGKTGNKGNNYNLIDNGWLLIAGRLFCHAYVLGSGRV
jgi:hypothetical protein